MTEFLSKAKEHAKKEMAGYDSLLAPKVAELVEKGIELAYRQGYLDGQEAMLDRLCPTHKAEMTAAGIAVVPT